MKSHHRVELRLYTNYRYRIWVWKTLVAVPSKIDQLKCLHCFVELCGLNLRKGLDLKSILAWWQGIKKQKRMRKIHTRA